MADMHSFPDVASGSAPQKDPFEMHDSIDDMQEEEDGVRRAIFNNPLFSAPEGANANQLKKAESQGRSVCYTRSLVDLHSKCSGIAGSLCQVSHIRSICGFLLFSRLERSGSAIPCAIL